ncbi:MAG: hypothetical protein J6B98_00555 [Bacilli bacterium]|nr:hypothetical protein [Bacilli bacterium]
MKNELKNIIKELSGNVLAIGISQELVEVIDKNEKIINCDILSNEVSKEKKFSFFRRKTININKLRKKYKKKRIDYIICDYNIISPYIRKFVKNSVYINKNKLYFYGNIDTELIKNMYGRYDTKINIKEYKKNYIVEIDNTNSKNNFIKDLCYSIKDTITYLIEVVGDILMG